MSDDRVLVAQSTLGDHDAFARLLRRHDDAMRGVVWRLVPSPSAMDDVLQDAYLKAWRALANFRGDSAFSSWLYRIVYTTAIDHVRAAGARRVVALDDAREPSVEDQTDSVAQADALRRALASLPADQLAVVALVDGQGQSYDAVAALLDISPGTVGSRLNRARAALRRALGPDRGGRA